MAAPAKVGDVLYGKCSYSGTGENQLSFRRGDILEVCGESLSADWCWCTLDGRHGYAPVNHLVDESEWEENGIKRCQWQGDECTFTARMISLATVYGVEASGMAHHASAHCEAERTGQ
eukprot:m.199453 g.199453  ORF g.199453 m.199453 type:complete len:118 (+) comp39571_c0_seq12:213-566(+)